MAESGTTTPSPDRSGGGTRPNDGAPAAGGTLGTFAGVFTPSILTILGIILFLRLGYVVGNAGLWRALLVMAVANSISILTSFSLAAIATNFRVKGGGDYYLISRTLGPEFGGAIGLVLFLAQSVSVAFYAIGFAEGVSSLLAIEGLDPRLIAGGALLPLFALSWLGSDWATKFQYAIMAVLVVAIGSFLIGAFGAFDSANLAANTSPAGDLTFWALFALFFPAVTGFTQGVSMSGDLRDPARSLPRGTFLAVAVSLVVYLGIAILLAGALPGSELIADYEAMNRIALSPWLISAGLFAATLSSALASFMGGPRILQALAADKLFAFLTPFSKVTAKTGNPRRAVLLAFVIAVLTVIFGNLNVVAPVVSMFFLISYGLLNYATYYEASAQSPSFRPRFRGYHPWVSLIGCFACGGAMLAIDLTAGAVAFAVLMGIHQYLKRAKRTDRWADGSRSAILQELRKNLFALEETVAHDRDWRPMILAVSEDPTRRERIIRFASWIEGGSGLTTAVRLQEGEGVRARAEGAAIEAEMAAQFAEGKVQAFPRVIVSPDRLAGFRALVQGAGIGSIRPNVALFNWFDQEHVAESAPAMQQHGELMRSALRHGCHLVVLSAPSAWFEQMVAVKDSAETRKSLVIDVWWHDDASSRLALLLAYLMTRRDPWSEAKIRVLASAGDQSDEDRLAELRAMLDEVRIVAEAVIVPDTRLETLREWSSIHTLAFIPARLVDCALCDTDRQPIPTNLEGCPALALVQAVSDIALDTQPDEGPQAEAAREEDAREARHKRAARLRTEATAKSAVVKQLEEQLAQGVAAGEAREALEGELEAARQESENAERRAVKAEALVELDEARDRAISKPSASEEEPESPGTD